MEAHFILCWKCNDVQYPAHQTVTQSHIWSFHNGCKEHIMKVEDGSQRYEKIWYYMFSHSLFPEAICTIMKTYTNCQVNQIILNASVDPHLTRCLKKLVWKYRITKVCFKAYHQNQKLPYDPTMPWKYCGATHFSAQIYDWIRSDFSILHIENEQTTIDECQVSTKKVFDYVSQNYAIANKTYQKQYWPDLKLALAQRFLTKIHHYINSAKISTLKHDYCFLYWTLSHYLIKDVVDFIMNDFLPCFVPVCKSGPIRWVFNKKKLYVGTK